MDLQVLKVQKWLNTTYSGVSGYTSIEENGKSTWETIYALRKGLQHELGISPVSEGFGPQTESALSSVINNLKIGYSGNIAQLIKGAFWCKGISPDSFDGNFDPDTKMAFSTLQSNAGLHIDGVVTVMLMKALFDMSAFTLIYTDDMSDSSVQQEHQKVQNLQRYLNAKYSDELNAILPCDGIYQRDTNKALIYAYQRELGFSSDSANGFYGPGTIANTKALSLGDRGEQVKIIQYALFLNGFYSGAFNSFFDMDVVDSVKAFRKFMNLPPFTGQADLTVIKGLLTSNGNTGRDSNTADTSKQLSSSDAALLKQYGFDIVGRYLTGSVGVGTSKRDKYLTTTEIQSITENGISIFPIYQDGGWDLSYFTYEQGVQDAKTALNAAVNLNFPKGSTIYFAVDVDIQEGDIQGTVLEYFRGISKSMYFYNVGVYGTRNVANHVISKGYATLAFVSDMSSGYSGNLAYKMPEKWAFDQFIEYSIKNVPIDQVASSGLDIGSNKFHIEDMDFVKEWANSLIKNLPIFGHVNFNSKDNFTITGTGWKLKAKVSYGETVGNNFDNSFLDLDVENGKIALHNKKDIEKFKNLLKGKLDKAINIEDVLNDMASKIESGKITIQNVFEDGTVGFKFSFKDKHKTTDYSETNMQLEFTILLDIDFPGIGKELFSTILKGFELASQVGRTISDFVAGALDMAGKVVIGVLVICITIIFGVALGIGSLMSLFA